MRVEPKISDVEYNYTKHDLNFRVISDVCYYIKMNDIGVVTRDMEKLFVKTPWIAVSLSTEFYPINASSSGERKE
jgi:hypothetical protein